jgi:hypothetical protein
MKINFLDAIGRTVYIFAISGSAIAFWADDYKSFIILLIIGIFCALVDTSEDSMKPKRKK